MPAGAQTLDQIRTSVNCLSKLAALRAIGVGAVVLEQRALTVDGVRDLGLRASAGPAALGPHDVGVTTDDHERLHQPISRDGRRLSGIGRKAGTEPLIAIAPFRSDIPPKDMPKRPLGGCQGDQPEEGPRDRGFRPG